MQLRNEVPQQRSVVGYGGRPTQGSNKVTKLEQAYAMCAAKPECSHMELHM